MDRLKFNEEILRIFADAAKVLGDKEEAYGSSWKKRGGVGAFMMLARKWDRIETQVKHCSFDIFSAIEASYEQVDGLIDDIRDLRNYLTLVELEMKERCINGIKS